MFGSGFGLLRERGAWRELADGRRAFATVHPSYLLRMPSGERDAAWDAFVRDLRLINDVLG